MEIMDKLLKGEIIANDNRLNAAKCGNIGQASFDLGNYAKNIEQQ